MPGQSLGFIYFPCVDSWRQARSMAGFDRGGALSWRSIRLHVID